MINESNCFPEDWIGGTLKKESARTYFVHGVGTQQVWAPSGYSDPTNAYWLEDKGVLVMCCGDVTIYFVGSQKYFPAYKGENEPHDINGYKKAVAECIKLREQEKESKYVKTKERTKEEPAYSSTQQEPKEESWFKKALYTILLVLPIWWCIKFVFVICTHYIGLLFLIPWRIITWPFRAILSSDTKILTDKEMNFETPHYSFKRF